MARQIDKSGDYDKTNIVKTKNGNRNWKSGQNPIIIRPFY